MKNKGQPPNDELATQCVANLQKSSAEALARIRSRPRVNPTDFGLPDSTDLIRGDRDR
jgi:hypothetical protein